MKQYLLIIMLYCTNCHAQFELPLCLNCIDTTLVLSKNLEATTKNGKVVWRTRSNNFKESRIMLWDGSSIKQISNNGDMRNVTDPIFAEQYIYWASVVKYRKPWDKDLEKYRHHIIEYSNGKRTNITQPYKQKVIGSHQFHNKYVNPFGKRITWIAVQSDGNNIVMYDQGKLKNITAEINMNHRYINLLTSDRELMWRGVDYNGEKYNGHSLPTYVYWYDGNSVRILDEENTKNRAKVGGIVNGEAIWQIFDSGEKSGFYISNGIKNRQLLQTNDRNISTRNKNNGFAILMSDYTGITSKYIVYNYSGNSLHEIVSTENQIADFAVDGETVALSLENIDANGNRKYALHYYSDGELMQIGNTVQKEKHRELDVSDGYVCWQTNNNIYVIKCNSD